MTDELGEVEEPFAVTELHRLQEKYRKQNIANDRARELIEEDINSGRYNDEQADEISRSFEESCRAVLDRIQDEIEAHCRAYNLRITASQWTDE